LNFVDETGESVCLEVSFEHAQSIAMTLPRILSCALRSISGSPQSRFVFPLGEWTLEVPEGREGLILTLATAMASVSLSASPLRPAGRSAGR
jgi:hypothetical protein